MRSGLLLTAATTVAVPGLLAVLGVVTSGHVSASAARAGMTGALGAAALTGPFPVAPPSARAGVRNDVAGVQSTSGGPVTVLSRLTVRQQALGLKLLAAAATAGQSVSYQGTERTAQAGVGGQVSVISQVWHQGGGQTVVQATETAGGTSGTVRTPDTVTGAPAGVFGVTSTLVGLLQQHYVTAYQGSGSVAARPALVVDVYRFDGSLAARYWLDRQSLLPLRREVLGAADQTISEDAFVQVQVDTAQVNSGAKAGAETGQQLDRRVVSLPLSTPWVAAASATGYLGTLSASGWKLPATLSGSLPLYSAAWTSAPGGKVVDLEYSDGLYTVSLFVQQGNLSSDLPGWQPVRLAGQRAYLSGHSVTWAGSGLVYTMIADAPAATVRQVVAALPASEPPGVVTRLGRGLERLARIADPLA